jgi:hypothetical protein
VLKDGFAVTVISGCLADIDVAKQAAKAATTSFFMIVVPLLKPKVASNQRVGATSACL